MSMNLYGINQDITKWKFDVQGIKLEDKKICELKEIDRVFFVQRFFSFS